MASQFAVTSAIVQALTPISGYQHQLTASVIANKGFIETFAPTPEPGKAPKLEASHVSAWGGIYR